MSPCTAWRRSFAAILASVAMVAGGIVAAQARDVTERRGAPGALSAAAQLQAIATNHVTVLFADPALEGMARRAAELAEEALAIVAGWFGSEPFPVTLHLDASTDVFNAIAAPIPRPTVALRFVPPLESGLGLGAEDWLELLLVHELAHLGHFTRTAAPAPGIGLVGEGVAPPPPLWLVEGLATWLESELTAGGRRDDALTAGLLATLAAGDAWPTFEAASTGTVRDWPAGRTRYLLGADFLDALIRAHGWPAVLQSIERFNAAPLWSTFEDAWSATTGESLAAAWEARRTDVVRAAEARAASLPRPPPRWTDTGGTTGLPSLSPGGDRLAWRTGAGGIAVADVGIDEQGRPSLGEPASFGAATRVESLDWLDGDTLLVTRIVPTPSSRFADVFVLDLPTGREARWTVDERAHFARGVLGTGCASWVRVVPGRPAAIVESCSPGGASTVRWEAPAGAEIVGYDRAEDGRAVVSVWASGRTGIAVLAPGVCAGSHRPGDAGTDATPWTPTWLTWDRHLDLDPVWTPDGTVRFRSDRTERFEIYEIDPRDRRLLRWTDTLGGAFQPAAAHALVLLGAEGFDLAPAPGEPRADLGVAPLVATAPDMDAPRTESGHADPASPSLEATTYDPWPSLAPFGWWPTRFDVGVAPARVAAQAQVLGQDASARHAWSVAFGLDTALAGPLGPAYASATYTWNPTGPFALWAPPRPATAWLQAGAWPHEPHLAAVSEIAVGVRTGGVVRFRDAARAAAARLELGVVRLPSREAWEPELRVEAVGTTAGADAWGYRGGGVRLASALRWTPTPTGPSFGAWADASARAAWSDAAVAGSVRFGYRQAPPIPLALTPWALVAGIEGRWHVPVAWRFGDGRYALERVTAVPALRSWWDGAGVGLGGDLRIGADLLVSYGVPVTVWVQGGWSQVPWGTVGIGVPF